MIDLLNIAKTEANSGDLEKLLSTFYKPSSMRPKGFPNAIIWQGGNFEKSINPVAHAFTDAYALIGNIKIKQGSIEFFIFIILTICY